MELIRAQRTIRDLLDSTYSAVTYHELYLIAAAAAIDPRVARERRRLVGTAERAAARRARVAAGVGRDPSFGVSL